MNTKQMGDLAEQAVILQALKMGWEVCVPCGDRLPYDLIFDVNGSLIRIQVKCAWLHRASGNYVVDTRRTKTNRRRMRREHYATDDFDFAVVFLPEPCVFYVFPLDIFVSYGSEIHMVEAEKRQRSPKSASYREAWELIEQWAAQSESSVRNLSNSGKPSLEQSSRMVIPSQAQTLSKDVGKV